MTTAQLAAARGCLLGLALGDAIGAVGGETPDGTLRATSAGQLACFTVDGIIRAHLRQAHRGICHPPSVVRHAYTRWAALQQVPGITRMRQADWPDGWLASVPVLAARRGSAPATVAALLDGQAGAPASLDAEVLTRTLPAGPLGLWLPEVESFARDIAAITHAPAAAEAAAVAAGIIAAIISGHPITTAVTAARQAYQPVAWHDAGPALDEAMAAAASDPRDTEVLARLVPDATATSVLVGSVYVAASFPDPAEVRDALRFAGKGPGDGQVTAAVGALLGTAHGADALPADLVSRPELAWVADTLARDLVAEFSDSPAGSGFRTRTDSAWWGRYPGW